MPRLNPNSDEVQNNTVIWSCVPVLRVLKCLVRPCADLYMTRIQQFSDRHRALPYVLY